MVYRERPDPVPPTQDERTFAMLAHLLACFGGGFIAPLIILLSKKDSRFVKFHAIQAVVERGPLVGAAGHRAADP